MRAISWNLLSQTGSPGSECLSSQCETSMITSLVIRRNFMTSSLPWTSAIFERPQVHRGLEVLTKVPGRDHRGRSGIKIEYCLPHWNSTAFPLPGKTCANINCDNWYLETTIWLLALSWKNLTYLYIWYSYM